MSTNAENLGTPWPAPKQVLDIENDRIVIATKEKFWSRTKFQSIGEDGALEVSPNNTVPLARPDDEFQNEYDACLKDRISRGTIRDFAANSEVTEIGKLWRFILRVLLLLTLDVVNALRLTRSLQASLPFLSGYESYILGQLIEALDRMRDINYTLRVALSNRNVSRILVQVVGERLDWAWHWSTQITWSRQFDGWGQFPIIGMFIAFPDTENFPSTRNFVLASILRVLLGPGRWFTRLVTGGHQSLQTNNPENKAQDLAAENGFERANRSQFGPHVGRRVTNKFRSDHRLPTDESIVRTFVTQPMSTLLNNGAVHVLRVLAKHWRNILDQPGGNFAHQRMEQLNPFETLRFHMPIVLQTLSSLRGRNQWDMEVLGPMVRELQELEPESTADTARLLINKLRQNIVINVCGGVKSLAEPFFDWLDALCDSCSLLEGEAEKIRQVVKSVATGMDVGHDLISQVSWAIPSDKKLEAAILDHIGGSGTADVPEKFIRSAMDLMAPRDKRTLIELVNNGLGYSKPGRLLMGRAKTLLQREMRRGMLDGKIRELSKGRIVEECEADKWYWLEFCNDDKNAELYIYHEKVPGLARLDAHLFVNADTGREKLVSFDGSVKCFTHVPIAEAISRAQRVFMNIELDHGKKFAYGAFTEFTDLRMALRRLVVISQMTCEELDKARLNFLAEVQRSNQTQVSIYDLVPGEKYYTYDSKAKEYKLFVCEKKYTVTDPEWATLAGTRIVSVPPQSMVVLGGGPSGLMTSIHCTESVLTSGGVIKLYEDRDSFAKGASTFERAQIVRLDARWIAMLRYHLGTGFEDVFIPASGETNSHLGNTLPTQGFVEITIKDLEYMLHAEVCKMWSKGLLSVHTDSRATYDPVSNSLTKLGKHLKLDDVILRGENKDDPWKVAEVSYADSLGVGDLRPGEEYGICVGPEILSYRLQTIGPRTKTYSFIALQPGKPDIHVDAAAMPHVYPKGTRTYAQVSTLVVESVKKGSSGGYARESLPMEDIMQEKFFLDISHTHVVDCSGEAPEKSKVHFVVTPDEPHGVCCMQGLKISMGMHNFGEKRWGSGVVDDILSPALPNNRIVGDFTKKIRASLVPKKMNEFMKENKDWRIHFIQLTTNAGFTEPNALEVVPKIQNACEVLADKTFTRQSLQTRFFETGDNYYLGMELPREYDKWKTDLITEVVAPLSLNTTDEEAQKREFSGILNHHIDRLWYDGVLEVIRKGDVYNAGARRRIPRLYLINSYTDVELGSLPVGESFRLSSSREEKFEVVIKQSSQVLVRNVEGFISKMSRSTMVRREGNLTRGPDGNAESKVSLSSFNVKHVVSFRTAVLLDSEKGYLVAFLGDRQATPHFMRYSGLTGACINAMLLNNFIKQAIDGVPVLNRFRDYSDETNWSNGEVVQRGTGANYGEDGFLRPGFTYDHCMDYLYSKVIEYREIHQDPENDQEMDNVLSGDWINKFAAALVPRGMECNEDFKGALRRQWHQTVFNKFVKEAIADKSIGCDWLENALQSRGENVANQRGDLDYWDTFLKGLNIDGATKQMLADPHIVVAKRLDQMCSQIVEFAEDAYTHNKRISSELSNQPKPVDFIVDDFAVEAQNFANSLVMSAAFASGALAFTLLGERVASVVGAVLAGLNIVISFGTMTEVSRYKLRNEEARAIFYEEKILNVLRGVFSLMNREQRLDVPMEENPYEIALEDQVDTFKQRSEYYGYDPKDFTDEYEKLRSNINDPEAIRGLQNRLTTEFIPVVYSVNSYLQQCLVEIYKTLEGMHRLPTAPAEHCTKAQRLFHRLSKFSGDLKGALQLGNVRLGFFRKRPVTQWQCTTMFKHWYTFICCAARCCVPPTAPISAQILSLLRETRHLAALQNSGILGREIRDLESLYWATRESDRASLIFMNAFLAFIASVIFTIARIFDVDVLLDVSFWALAASAIGAIIATLHFCRKLVILSRLFMTLGSKVRDARSVDDRSNIRQVRGITFTQILLTLTRLASSAGAAVALPWSIAERQFPDQIGTDDNIPFWIALGAVCTAVGATAFFFLVEFRIRYRLDPKLGEFVCESFSDEIEEMFELLSLPINNMDTLQEQTRETWDYVAREFLHTYRFDTVFAADRFGSILRYIQGGKDRLEKPSSMPC